MKQVLATMSVKLIRANTICRSNEALEWNDSEGLAGVAAQEKTKNTEPDLPPVSFLSLFRFASVTDRLLLVVAVVASVANGLCYPFITILLGDLTNALVSGKMNQTVCFNQLNLSVPPGFNET